MTEEYVLKIPFAATALTWGQTVNGKSVATGGVLEAVDRRLRKASDACAAKPHCDVAKAELAAAQAAYAWEFSRAIGTAMPM